MSSTFNVIYMLMLGNTISKSSKIQYHVIERNSTCPWFKHQPTVQLCTGIPDRPEIQLDAKDLKLVISKNGNPAYPYS
jgi:hypothetical protein